MAVAIKAADSFEHQKFSWQIFVSLEQSCSASDGSCDRSRLNFCFGPVSRNLHQNRAATEVDLASLSIETENGVSAQARDRQVGEGQFGAGI